MNWVLFSLLASLFWVCSNFIDKYVLEKHTQGIADFLFLSAIGSWLLAAVVLLFNGLPVWNASSWIPLLTGIILICSYGFYTKALSYGDTSSLVILFKLIPVMTLVLGFVFLHQTLSSKEVLGFIIVLLGAFLVSFERTKRTFTKGFRMILIAMMMWSVLALLIDYGLTKISFWDFVFLDNVGSGLTGIVLLLIPSVRRQILKGVRTAHGNKYVWFMGNNLTDFLGQLSFKSALAVAPSAGLVTVVMQVQSFYAIVIGALLTLFLPNVIKENISARMLTKKCIGALVMFSGIYVLMQ